LSAAIPGPGSFHWFNLYARRTRWILEAVGDDIGGGIYFAPHISVPSRRLDFGCGNGIIPL
jgi:hypothetical protein